MRPAFPGTGSALPASLASSLKAGELPAAAPPPGRPWAPTRCSVRGGSPPRPSPRALPPSGQAGRAPSRPSSTGCRRPPGEGRGATETAVGRAVGAAGSRGLGHEAVPAPAKRGPGSRRGGPPTCESGSALRTSVPLPTCWGERAVERLGGPAGRPTPGSEVVVGEKQGAPRVHAPLSDRYVTVLMEPSHVDGSRPLREWAMRGSQGPMPAS